jgi:hypothetical protein
LVDFDGKGRLDLLSGSNRHDAAGFHLFRRNDDGTWAPRKRLQVKYAGKYPDAMFIMHHESFVTAVDWNGDGVPDLLCVAPQGEGILVALRPFKESEPIALSHKIEFTPQGHVWDFAVADWDRDGKPDLLVRQSLPDRHGKRGMGIYWYKNLGGTGLPKLAEGKLLVGEKELVGEKSSDFRVTGFCLCDWNGDEWPDLIVTRDEPTRTNPEGRPLAWRGTALLYLRE